MQPRYLWSSVLVSSAISVFMLCGSGTPKRVPHENPIEGREGDGQCDALSSSQIHTTGGAEISTLAAKKSLTNLSSERPAPADGFSLVHRAAGSLFVEHVLSKGNSIDLWQGFLSFVGE